MRRKATSLGRLDALVARTEQRIADQEARIEAARRGARASGRMTCRLADLKVDLLAYRQARGAVAEAQRLPGRSAPVRGGATSAARGVTFDKRSAAPTDATPAAAHV